MEPVQTLTAKALAVKPRLGVVVLRASSKVTEWKMRRNEWQVQHLLAGFDYTFSIDADRGYLNAWAMAEPSRAQVKAFIGYCGADENIARKLKGADLLADAPGALKAAGACEPALSVAERVLPPGYTALSAACLQSGARESQIEEIYAVLLAEKVPPANYVPWLKAHALELANSENVSAKYAVLRALATARQSQADVAMAALLCELKRRELDGHTGTPWGRLNAIVAKQLGTSRNELYDFMFPVVGTSSTGKPKRGVDQHFDSIDKDGYKFIARDRTALREVICAKGFLHQARKRQIVPFALGALPRKWEAAQRAVAQHIATHPLTILVGPAGSGKTMVAKAMARAVRASGGTVALTATTGKAAKVLDKEYGQTLHSFLGALPGAISSNSMHKNVQLLVVDETSMLDAMLASPLGAYLSQDRAERVLLVGDPYQIPPVGPGAVLRDLMSSPYFADNVVSLAKVMRTEDHDKDGNKNDVLALAEHIRLGTLADALGRGEDLSGPGVELIPMGDDYEAVAKRVADMVGDDYERTLVISAEYASPLGVYALNRRLRDRHLGVSDDAWREGERVIQCQNIKVDETIVANGTFGEIAKIGADGSLRVRYDGGAEALYEPEQVLHGRGVIEPAYALTVHRAQGSEADRVIVVVDPSPQHGWMWQDPGLGYTAVTRAKKHVTIVGDLAVLAGSPAERAMDRRLTGLKERVERSADRLATKQGGAW